MLNKFLMGTPGHGVSYLQTLKTERKPCLSLGKPGAASKTRIYSKEQFRINLVQGYALLLIGETHVSVWQPYGDTNAHKETIHYLIGKGWIPSQDFKR